MLSYKESLKILKETNALLEGHFILSSGLHSKHYVQCAKLLSHPSKAEIICSSLCDKIKKAFKNIAKKEHPDRGGDVKVFKEANEAYDTLKDTQKRAAYDQYGHDAFRQGGMGGAQGFGDFGGVQTRPGCFLEKPRSPRQIWNSGGGGGRTPRDFHGGPFGRGSPVSF